MHKPLLFENTLQEQGSSSSPWSVAIIQKIVVDSSCTTY